MATELRGERVVLRALTADDTGPLRAIHRTPEVTRWWGEMEDGFPDDEPEATRFAVLVDGRIAGMIQYGEEDEPAFRHAWVDIFLDPGVHGRGVGADAVATLARHLIEQRGHHRVTIDPAVENEAAIRAYEKAGFQRVGVMRSAWRGPDGAWRDVLFMELVVPQ